MKTVNTFKMLNSAVVVLSHMGVSEYSSLIKANWMPLSVFVALCACVHWLKWLKKSIYIQYFRAVETFLHIYRQDCQNIKLFYHIIHPYWIVKLLSSLIA